MFKVDPPPPVAENVLALTIPLHEPDFLDSTFPKAYNHDDYMSVEESQINAWANSPSETENEKCENAISQITDALRGHFGNKIYFVRQGSHRNRTNVKLDSDVDIAVVHVDSHFTDTTFLSESDKRLHDSVSLPASYRFSQFKNEVCAVLEQHFGATSVHRKNKCIRVLGNTSRVNADVVPAFEHTRYSSFGVVSAVGIEFVMDLGGRKHSFPDQHYANGVKKNDDTGRAYKSVVRIIKNVRNEFVDQRRITLENMPSFFIESLVWNVPNNHFGGTTWREDAESVALKIWSDMQEPIIADRYAEVSDLMWLFRGNKRTPKQAEDFMLQVWSYIKK